MIILSQKSSSIATNISKSDSERPINSDSTLCLNTKTIEIKPVLYHVPDTYQICSFFKITQVEPGRYEHGGEVDGPLKGGTVDGSGSVQELLFRALPVEYPPQPCAVSVCRIDVHEGGGILTHQLQHPICVDLARVVHVGKL